MKFMIVVVLALVAVASAQRRFFNNFPQSPDDEYAASLAGAPLGLYEKRQGNFFDPRRGQWSQGSEAYGLSLGNARVGLYGKEQRQGLPRIPIVPKVPVNYGGYRG